MIWIPLIVYLFIGTVVALKLEWQQDAVPVVVDLLAHIGVVLLWVPLLFIGALTWTFDDDAVG